MLSNKEIRALSREQLKGHWLKFALINLVMMILAGGCSYIASSKQIMSLTFVQILLQLIIGLGIYKLLLEIAKGKGFSFSNFWQPGRVYLRYLLATILLTLLVFVINLILMAILLAPPINIENDTANRIAIRIKFIGGANSVMVGISGESILPFLASAGGGLLVLLFIEFIVMFAINIYITYSYMMLDLIVLGNHDDIGAIDSLGASRKLMKGYKWRLFKLMLSFIGWAILCIFTLGIGLLWLSTYINMSIVNFYLELLKEREELAKELNLVEPVAAYSGYTGDYQTQDSENVEVKAIEEVKVEEPVKTEDPTQDSE